MNAYDFDDTIYAGESSYDFFVFCLKRDIWLLKYMPEVVLRLLQYKCNCLKLDRLIHTVEKIVISYLKKNKISIDEAVREFWKENRHKLKPQFLKKLQKDDLIITGAPRFLVEGVQEELKTNNLICTEVNIDPFKIEFLCLQENKVKAFKEKYPDTIIENFYTDSLSDIPMMQYAKNVYFVNGNSVRKMNKYCK